MRGAIRRSAALTPLLLLAIALPASAQERWDDPDDPILHGDPIDPATGWPAYIVPGLPWIGPGPDGHFGTADDLVDPTNTGDVDLIVETGRNGVQPVGVCEPFGRGVSIPFRVRPSDGTGVATTAPAYFEGLPILGVAFADLDDDGYIGVTRLDGDASDDRLEAAELQPVGRRYAQPGSNGQAIGQLVVTTGGPPGREVRIAIAAVTYAGPISAGYLGARVPEGPAVTTRLPFLPVTDPHKILPIDRVEVLAADPDGRVAVDTQIALAPDPSDPRIGEGFTLRLDGSDPTIGLATARSGAAVRFGVAVLPDREHYTALPSRQLRPALDDDGKMMPVEIARRVLVADDGRASQTRIRIVALDRLGNVAEPDGPTEVRLKADKDIVIVSPNLDGKDRYETLTIADARGVEVILDDAKGAYDSESVGRLRLRSRGRVERIDIVMPDPDVDESGEVNFGDYFAYTECLGLVDGDPGFAPQLDLDANGRIEAADLLVIQERLGSKMKKDGRSKIRKKDGVCFDGKKRKAKDWTPVDDDDDDDDDDGSDDDSEEEDD